MIVKTEGGAEYPAEAYAFVPDASDPSTWRLRIWETPERKVTTKQLGRAVAALSPGGHDGKRTDIPDGDRSVVKATLRALYREDDAGASVPHWIQETQKGKAMKEQRISAASIVQLTEDAFDPKTGMLSIRIIQPGFNKGKTRYYPEKVCERDHPIFAQRKMFIDHQTKEERRSRPERSTKDDVAQMQETWTVNGEMFAKGPVYDPVWKAKLASMQEAGCLASQAVSICTGGIGVKGKVEGHETMIVERLIGSAQTSVDFVTYAGAGGAAVMMEAEIPETDVEMIDLELLKERRPDLVEQIMESGSRNKTKDKTHITEAEEMEKVEELELKLEEANKKLAELEGQDEAKQLKEAQDVLTKTQKELGDMKAAEAKAKVATEIEEAIDKAKLPDELKGLLRAQFSEVETVDGLKEAIDQHVEAFGKMSKAGKVMGLGESTAGSNTDDVNDKDDRLKLIEVQKVSIRRQHPRITEVEVTRKAEAFADAGSK